MNTASNIDVLIVDTQVANIASMIAALKRLGATPRLSQDPHEIAQAAHVVLPGVGAFGPGMQNLESLGIQDALKERITQDKHTLCVCLGLQLLTKSSEEAPGVQGLGVLNAHVVRFEHPDVLVPQLGWNKVSPREGCVFLQEGYAYFANSFHLDRIPEGWHGATSTHGDTFVAAVERGHVLACQFHPELSGAWGLALMERWITHTGAPTTC